MTSRPRRSAANKAKETISVHVAWADNSDRGSPAAMSSRRSNRVVRDDVDSTDDSHHEVPSKRQSTRGAGRRGDDLGTVQVRQGQRDRGGKKKYVVDDSSPEEFEDDEEEVEEDDSEDAEGDDDMDIDAEGEEDAEGDADMDVDTPATDAGNTIKISRGATKPKPSSRAAAQRVIADDDDEEEEEEEDQEDDDDDDELSDPADSEAGDQTLGLGDETGMADDDEDAEGEVDGEGETQELGSDMGDSQDEEPDLTKMTKRQRARFEETGEEDFLKLSDEVQAKKVFTAEELSMRRQEMARRRRNLSDKRNEEVKMETINKLLKKQAPKVNKKAAAAAAAADASPEDPSSGVNPVFVRWASTKDGSRVSIPKEMVDGPMGRIFRTGNGGFVSGKMVEEVV